MSVTTEVIEVTISQPSAEILDKLVACGIYGIDRDQVAGRFIDTMLLQFVEHPRFDAAGWVRHVPQKPPKVCMSCAQKRVQERGGTAE